VLPLSPLAPRRRLHRGDAARVPPFPSPRGGGCRDRRPRCSARGARLPDRTGRVVRFTFRRSRCVTPATALTIGRTRGGPRPHRRRGPSPAWPTGALTGCPDDAYAARSGRSIALCGDRVVVELVCLPAPGPSWGRSSVRHPLSTSGSSRVPSGSITG